jgi:hypothetical protein
VTGRRTVDGRALCAAIALLHHRDMPYQDASRSYGQRPSAFALLAPRIIRRGRRRTAPCGVDARWRASGSSADRATMKSGFSLDRCLSVVHARLVDESLLSAKERRALHLVDIENSAGGADCPPVEMERSASIAVCQALSRHQMVVALSHRAASAAWFAAPAHAMRVVRSDGADLALLAYDRVAGRCDSSVIGSGDGVVADAVAHLHRLVMAVTVVTTCPQWLSGCLRVACHDMRSVADPRAYPAFGRAL